MKRNKIQPAVIGLVLIISILAGYITPLQNVYGYTKKAGVVTVSGGYNVNVRTGPGTGYNNVTSVSGSSIKLPNGHSVDVIGEDYASDGKLWYEISFKYTDGETYTGYIHSDYVTIDDTVYEEDEEFEKYLEKQGFPESYKVYLRTLHAKYPNWVFEADKLDYDWEEAVKAESKLGRNLVTKNAISSWKSTVSGAFDYENNKWVGLDGDSWVAASEKIIAYYMDPRNFLDEDYIFQFELLSYDEELHNEEGLANVIKGTFLETGFVNDEGYTYSRAIMSAAKKSGVSPYHLAASIIQEQGRNGTSDSISGTVKGYEKIYNFYNWGAYAANGNSAIINGLIYASGTDEATLRPWNTKYKSIVGGAIKKGKEYISIGQDTQYYIKFDFVGTPYTHQYMTNIQAAASEGYLGSKAYTDEMKKEVKLIFKIPIFENMPENQVPCPTGTGNPNTFLKSLTVEGVSLTPTFYFSTTAYNGVVENKVSSVNITAQTIDANASVNGTGKVELTEGTNDIKVTVTAENGSVRNYTITIIREEADKPIDVAEGVTISTEKYFIGDGNITGIELSTNVSTFINGINVTGAAPKLFDIDGKEYTGNIGTGMKLSLLNVEGVSVKDYSIIIYGDINGDGEISIKDLLKMKKHILGTAELEGVYAVAGDVDKKEDGVTLKDYLKVKKQILGDGTISQQ